MLAPTTTTTPVVAASHGAVTCRDRQDVGVLYVRFESPTANSRGAHVGIFGLANGLARTGRLTSADHAWWRAANDWFTAAYPDPARTDPTLFDRTVHPRTACWFAASATHLLARVPGHLALLDRYDVAWVERRSEAPGRVLYEDAVQIVVVPATAGRDRAGEASPR